MNNFMFCSCGRRAQLLKFLKRSVGESHKIIATDMNSTAPALYMADKRYVVPPICSSKYLETILNIAIKNDVRSITTLIDPEIEVLSSNRILFEKKEIIVLAPSVETASLCFDKYKMFEFLKSKNIRTVLTYSSLSDFKKGLHDKEIDFPVFLKPRTGSGSVGICKCETIDEVESVIAENKHNYIIQELMKGGDCDADVYVDCFSHKPVAVFSKRKLETKIGGASKTISFKDNKLFEFVEDICDVFEFNGPVDMDFWYKDGEYYLSEINPRFGGAYLHAYGAGVDFFELIKNNMNGITNLNITGNYKNDIIMMMYDDVVIMNKKDLAQQLKTEI